MSAKIRIHVASLALIALVAFALNIAFFALTGIPSQHNLSSDATVHAVNWQEVSQSYKGQYENDVMFQAFPGVPTGVSLTEKILVRIGEFLHLPLLTLNIIFSWFSLGLFLSGVYFLAFYTLKNTLAALALALLSIVPVISLGLSGWGFLALGFVPKETAVGISIWLTILYLKGCKTDSKATVACFFALLGFFANWYPPVFCHYALVMLTVEVLRRRAIRVEHIAYGVLFLAAAPVAMYDIFFKAAHFAPPDLSIIVDYYGKTLQSPVYLLLHYLRKQILYAAIIGALWYVHRHVLKKETAPLMRVWYLIWWSTLLWSLVGVGIEVFLPLYMKYLISRISVWFYFASMIIVMYTGYELWREKFGLSTKSKALFFISVSVILLGQTSILSVYAGIRGYVQDADDYKQYLSAVTQLQTFVPPQSLVLANPDGRANTIRTYGGVGVYVAAKDGIVMLYDGEVARRWSSRYREVQGIFAQKDFAAIQSYAMAHDLQYYFFDKRDIQKGADLLAKKTVLQSGVYGLAKLY